MIPLRSVAALLIACVPMSAQANVIGNGAQNFNSIPSGIDFVTVHSSETLKPGVVNLGLFLNYAVNSLPYVDQSAQGRLDFNDTLLGMDLNAAIGILENWEVGFSVPSILSQTVQSGGTTHGEFVKRGYTEFRLSTKYRLLGDDNGGLALAGTVNFPRTSNNPYTGNNPGPTYNFEVAADTTIASKIAIGINLGVRLTNPGTPVADSLFQPIGDQLIAGVGASYLIPHTDTKLISEIFGSVALEGQSSSVDRSASSLEWIAGVKHDMSRSVAVHAGLGTELLHGIASPDWRVYTGINFSFGPIFSSKRTEIVRTLPGGDFIARNVEFEFDSGVMTGDYPVVMKEISDRLAQLGQYSKVIIEGHTDSVGRETYNLNLSQQRAETIRTYLVKIHGLNPARLEARGMGEAVPIADNGNFQGRQLNRRVEFKILR